MFRPKRSEPYVLVATLGDWQTMWDQVDTGSMESAFEDVEQAASDSAGAHPFADIRTVAAELDDPVGADLTRVGPRDN